MSTLVTTAPNVEQRSASLAKLALWVALGAYAALVAVGITHHEPWADEAQAWQIVRDLPLWRVLTHQLHYEGHPALWYLFLWTLQRLGFSYSAMHWPVALISVASTALLLFRSPFPIWARCALAFTFFLSFQYALVARDYSLAPLLFFLLATVWRRTNALPAAFVIGLMANLAMHCAAAGAGFTAVYAYELWRGKRRAKHVAGAAAIVLIAYALAALTIAPRPADLSFFPRASGPIPNLMVRLPGYALRSVAYVVAAFGKPWQVSLSSTAVFLWSLRHICAGRYLLPLLAVCAFSGFFFNFWHLGMFELTCITAAWMAWPLHFRSKRAQAGALLVFVGFLTVQLAWAAHAFRYDYSQPYSPDLVTANFLRPYVAAKVPMAVTYLNTSVDDPRALKAEEESVSYFHTVGLYPYFSGPLFINEPVTYWRWSFLIHRDNDVEQALAARPKLVVAVFFNRRGMNFEPSRDLARPRLRDLTDRGYVLTHQFCAAKPESYTEREHMCDLIFELP